MKTVKEITQALKEATTEQAWITELATDERAGVQKALKQFYSRLTKIQEAHQAHLERVAFDDSYRAKYGPVLAGVDEAGRGPLAGPVVTAAVVLPTDCSAFEGINDSKQLTKEQRANYAAVIKANAVAYAIHFQPVQVIDKINIYEATKRSMARSVGLLTVQPDGVLLDAMTVAIALPQENIIKGDAKSLSIAAASILAKTARDAYMDELAEKYPAYGFEQHAGYGTPQHLEALAKHGVTAEHRTSFEPIKSMVQGGWLK